MGNPRTVAPILGSAISKHDTRAWKALLPECPEPSQSIGRLSLASGRANGHNRAGGQAKECRVRTNYIMIDYENVQPEALSVLDQEHFKVMVFVGASQNKVSYEVAELLQRMGERGRYVKVAGNGSNALDFHIAFYIGQMVATEPEAYYHIISKDTGFDPLIAHLKTRKVFAARSRSVAEMPIVKASSTKSQPERIAVIVANLQQRGSAKPRTIKTLSSTIAALFKKSLTEDEIAGLLKAMEGKGHIAINDTKVTYSLPA
jgi:hypothetical protein